MTTHDTPPATRVPRPPGVDSLLDSIAADLAPMFAGVFGPETVRAHVGDAFDRISDQARIQTYLPILTGRIARDQLVRLAAEQENIRVTTTPEVLFVCVHNQGRSQMAAALLHHHAQGRVHVRSAGSAPADSVNPAVVEVMAELDIDISQNLPKKLLTEDVAASDVVITMGCGDACPIFPGKRYEDWALADPSGQGADAVRAIRDEIDQRVRALLSELVPDAASA
ncbi:arsenate reductase ArsC [Nocardioides nanhaiensis]|uniref:Phosphotyrosine protein phosphatase I domain-containing protein n=1 Tax=Nocardioides nanhaiensis TaxID=1476871 RepID=A0ABP8VQY8_9ACTN